MLKLTTKFELVDSWLKDNAESVPFSQSFEWEEILSREGKEVERLTVLDEDTPTATALIEYHRLPFGWRYAFCPKGPVLQKNLSVEHSRGTVMLMADYLRLKKCVFFRIEPMSEIAGARKVFDFNPRATLLLNLRQTPDELLTRMHQKTRYNINLAQKKNLRVSDAKDADVFMALMNDTARRDRFRLHETRHYHEIIFSPLSHQLTVYEGVTPVATAVFAGFGEVFTYVFGASDYNYRNLMAPYLIQWEGIKLGQRFGYSYYDFFGVAPKIGESAGGEFQYDQKHQYAGVTRFKLGFGGEYQEAPGTFDLVLWPFKYKLYRFLRRLRRLL